MAKLIYASNMSLDGWTEDERGAFDGLRLTTTCSCSSPSSCGPQARTCMGGACTRPWLCGRPTPPWPARRTSWPTTRAHGRRRTRSSTPRPWPQHAPRHSARTPLRPRAVRDLKAAASRDLLVGGPNLAAQALVAGLVDELVLFVWPVVLGGRTPALPTDMRVDLKLIDEHRFKQRHRPPPLSPSVTTQGPHTPRPTFNPKVAGSIPARPIGTLDETSKPG